MSRFLLAATLVFLACTARAGEFNKVLSIGDAAPAWSELPGTDDKTHSLDELKEKKLVLVVFTCNSCPVAVKYEDRIIELAKQHADDLAVVAINVNRVDEDSLEAAKERRKEKEFPYEYLYDESQQIAKDYGATGTPEFFLLSPERKILYMGALDDNDDAAKASVHYLSDALTAINAGQEPKTKETFAQGCRIRFARERKR
jgi:peroxiredoxin